MSELDEIRTRHEAGERGSAVDDREWLLGEVERLNGQRDEARAEARMLRAERDTLLLDAREFVRWFNAHYPYPSSHPDHPWCVINDRLNAHADTLAAIDAMLLAEIETTLDASNSAGLTVVES